MFFTRTKRALLVFCISISLSLLKADLAIVITAGGINSEFSFTGEISSFTPPSLFPLGIGYIEWANQSSGGTTVDLTSLGDAFKITKGNSNNSITQWGLGYDNDSNLSVYIFFANDQDPITLKGTGNVISIINSQRPHLADALQKSYQNQDPLAPSAGSAGFLQVIIPELGTSLFAIAPIALLLWLGLLRRRAAE